MKARWFIRGRGKLYGPLDDAKLRGLVAEGKIGESTELAIDPRGPWHPARRVRGLFTVSPLDDPKPLEGQSTRKPNEDNPSTPLPEGPPEASASIAGLPAKCQMEAVGGEGRVQEPENFGLSLASLQPIPVQRLADRFRAPTKKCPTCGKGCAQNARTCPQCGYRYPNMELIVVIGLVVVGLVIASIAYVAVKRKREEAEAFREVHRQSRERQEKLQQEIDDAWNRIREKLL